MTVLAISLVLDNPKNDPKMKRYRGKKEPPRHLRITDTQRTALRTMNRLFQNRRMALIHRPNGLVKMVSPHLDAIRHARRTQKQKTLEQLVVVRACVNITIAEKSF